MIAAAHVDFPDGAGGRQQLSFAAPRIVLVARTAVEVPSLLAAAENQARDGRWVVGFVAYEAAPAFDAALAVRPPSGRLPLAAFAAFDAPRADASSERDEAGFTCGPWQLEIDRTRFDAGVAAIRAGIAAGDYYQVNFTARLRAAFAGEPAALFDALRAAQPGGYALHLDGGDWQLLSVSPELFFDWRPGEDVTTRPMKGTAPRHADPAADAAAHEALRTSEKERAENLMIVDLLRNDLGRIAATGGVDVPRLFEVDALPTAWQMSSTVHCRPRPDLGLADIFAALFPCGSVTGAPKVAAMRAIAALEVSPRGAYCGALGLIRPGGHATFNVGIRTVAVDRLSSTAECGIGSGITLDSTAAAEHDEWLVKRRFLLRATAGFELLETLRLEAGAYVRRARHLTRLREAAAWFGFPWDAAAVDAALDAIAAEYSAGVWRVRLLLDRHGAAHVAAYPLDAVPADPVVALAASPVDSGDEFLRRKTTQRAIYDAHRPPPGIFDTLLWNEQGEITEFTRGNAVVELDGRRLTPPVSCGLLPGVLRGELLDRGEIVECVVRREDLLQATGLWFANSLRGLLPVRLDASRLR